MIDPFKKARDADRGAAIEVVEAAYAGRQITQPDCELRVDRLRRAETVGEVEMLVQDLHRTDHAVAKPRPSRVGAPRIDTSMLKRVLVALGVVGALGAAVPLGLLSDVQQERAVESGTFEYGDEVELTSARGYRALVDAIEERTGSRMIFTATIYAGYALVDLPVGETGQRSASYSFDGDWQERSRGSRSTVERFDLDRIDVSTVGTLLRKARRLVDGPTSTYLLVNVRDRDRGVCLSAYATNAIDETGYLDADCDGTVLSRHVG